MRFYCWACRVIFKVVRDMLQCKKMFLKTVVNERGSAQLCSQGDLGMVGSTIND